MTIHNGMAFLSGVTGMRDNGTYSAEPRTHFRDLFNTLEQVLASAGLTFADVLEMTTYHCDMAQFHVFREVRDEFVVEPWPAWTAVGTTELATPGAQAEVRRTCRVPLER